MPRSSRCATPPRRLASGVSTSARCTSRSSRARCAPGPRSTHDSDGWSTARTTRRQAQSPATSGCSTATCSTIASTVTGGVGRRRGGRAAPVVLPRATLEPRPLNRMRTTCLARLVRHRRQWSLRRRLPIRRRSAELRSLPPPSPSPSIGSSTNTTEATPPAGDESASVAASAPAIEASVGHLSVEHLGAGRHRRRSESAEAQAAGASGDDRIDDRIDDGLGVGDLDRLVEVDISDLGQLLPRLPTRWRRSLDAQHRRRRRELRHRPARARR